MSAMPNQGAADCFPFRVAADNIGLGSFGIHIGKQYEMRVL